MTRSALAYLLHGLTISSEIPLDEKTVSPGRTDLTVRYGDVRLETSEKDLLAELTAFGRIWYQAYAHHGSYLLRIPDLSDFAISSDLANVEAEPAGGTDEEALALLLAGTALSFILELRGACVFHAGAVEIGGKAVAFAGMAGRGKSTCTALMCALGRPLVADDVLRVEFGEEAKVFRGSSSLRLRQQAASVVDIFEERPPIRHTIDERLALSPPRSAPQLPLGAIVLPRPSRTIERVRLERLTGAEILLGLTEAVRTKGWRVKAHQQTQFEHLGRLSRQVPVYRADLPWGDPIPRETGEQLLGALESVTSHD